MNEIEISPRRMDMIWDADGSPDSVIALLYFLQHPDIHVLAATVSCRQAYPEIFAKKLTQMLAMLGQKGIPVAAGRSKPLEGNHAFPEPWRGATNDFWDLDLPEVNKPTQPLPAADLIISVLNQAPRPVSLFVSGTHTNLAEALRQDPEIKYKISAVHMMGGALHVPGNIESEWPAIHNKVAEWNIWVDPVATSEVFNAGLSIHITPLDATNQVIWTQEDLDAWRTIGNPEGGLAAEILGWMLDHFRELYPEGVYLWDLLAATNATDPGIVNMSQNTSRL